MNQDSRIFVAGHNGLVGSALVRHLKSLGYTNLILVDKDKVDLRDQREVLNFYREYSPEYVFLAAAKVGGIDFNRRCPADFIYDNLQIQCNVIHNSYRFGAKKLLFLGSACIYPKITPQPIKEEYLLSDYLEPTNEGYALAKIAGLKMCQMYNSQFGFNAVSVMPANLYGMNDNFRPGECHVIPALINKFHYAKTRGLDTVTCFGDGSPRREFLHVDDLAEACIFVMQNYNSSETLNIGSDSDISIKELSDMICEMVGFTGEIKWDTDKPNGTPVRKLDTSKLDALGWKAKKSLKDGLEDTYNWFVENQGVARL